MQVTISGGVAMALDCETGKELLGRADVALYKAKAAGRNLVYVHRGDGIQPVPPLAAEPIEGSLTARIGDSAARSS